MKLITKKSECRSHSQHQLVKSPKDAIRRTLSNYLIKDGVIVNIYQPSYVSKEAAVLRDVKYKDNFTIQLSNSSSFINADN